MHRRYRPGFHEKAIRTAQFFGFLGHYLYPLEVHLLDELISRLTPPRAKLVRAQLDTYVLYQRGGWDWTELNMYPKNPKSALDPKMALNVDSDDVKLALFHFRTALSSEAHHVVFHVVHGRLFCLCFGEPYRMIRFEKPILEKVHIRREPPHPKT
jgi:hypothetical protein